MAAKSRKRVPMMAYVYPAMLSGETSLLCWIYHTKKTTPTTTPRKITKRRIIMLLLQQTRASYCPFRHCFVLVDCSHYSPYSERNIRTLSHVIIASRCNPTGHGATHAPHW